MSNCILIFTKCYLPGYKSGGPIQTIANMVNAIGDQFEFRIVTMDRDSGDTRPYPSIETGCWNKVGKAFVRYLPPAERNFATCKKILSELDFKLIYCQSFFNPRFTILPLLALYFSKKRNIPVLIAPRGEFGNGALAHKSLKKDIYLFLFKQLLLKRLHYSFHVSSSNEDALLANVLGDRTRRLIALNFNAQEHISPQSIAVSDRKCLRLAFFGRIDVQKNVDYALTVISSVKSPLSFDLYGAIADEKYYKKCLQVLEQVPDNISLSFKGTLPHPEVLNVLQEYDLFFFPTKNENFGHTIHEALRSGLPVLCSDQTPWHELESRNAGWEVPLDRPDLFTEKIEQFVLMSPEKRYQMRLAALQYGIDVSNNKQTYHDNVNMFNMLLGTNDHIETDK